MSERKQLLKKLQEAQFALIDLTLYLDTHPTDVNALEDYDKYRDLTQALKDKFTSKFGPLSSNEVKSTDRFSWIDNPWPWEVTE